MSYVFALACYNASPLYVLDENDAALDEHNQVSCDHMHYVSYSSVVCELVNAVGRVLACGGGAD